DLVEQRLEQVVVVAVDDQQLRGRAAQLLGGKEPTKAAADDHHPRACLRHRLAPPGKYTPDLGMITAYSSAALSVRRQRLSTQASQMATGWAGGKLPGWRQYSSHRPSSSAFRPMAARRRSVRAPGHACLTSSPSMLRSSCANSWKFSRCTRWMWRE